jgi:hypothetical protein
VCVKPVFGSSHSPSCLLDAVVLVTVCVTPVFGSSHYRHELI